MKRYASVMICVMCVMLASVLRHVVLHHAKAAAEEYSRNLGSAVLMEVSVLPEAGFPDLVNS